MIERVQLAEIFTKKSGATLRAVACAENFHGGVFIQWHMGVICV